MRRIVKVSYWRMCVDYALCVVWYGMLALYGMYVHTGLWVLVLCCW